MDRRRKKFDSLVNLYRFCCFKTNFRNNHKYLFGHPLRLDTFKIKRKLTFKKITFLIELTYLVNMYRHQSINYTGCNLTFYKVIKLIRFFSIENLY